MKKNKILLLGLLSTSILTSCSNPPRYNEDVLNQFGASIGNKTFESVTMRGEGHALHVEDAQKTLANRSVEGTSSMYLSLPLKVDSENFYKIDEKGNMDKSCQFYSIYTKLVDENSYTGITNYIDQDNNLVLIANNANNQLSIKNVFDEISRINARWNIKFVYDSNGYLKEEILFSSNYGKDPNIKTVNLKSIYEYK